ncbi:MAG: LiaI-LiaF-like domain-containing protein, partial [bacterium]
GALFLADQLGALAFGSVFKTWWPALLVLAGLLNLIERPTTPLTPVLMITVGVALVLVNLGMIEFDRVWRLWPVILIGLGLNILFGGKNKG